MNSLVVITTLNAGYGAGRAYFRQTSTRLMESVDLWSLSGVVATYMNLVGYDIFLLIAGTGAGPHYAETSVAETGDAHIGQGFSASVRYAFRCSRDDTNAWNPSSSARLITIYDSKAARTGSTLSDGFSRNGLDQIGGPESHGVQPESRTQAGSVTGPLFMALRYRHLLLACRRGRNDSLQDGSPLTHKSAVLIPSLADPFRKVFSIAS